MPICIVCICTAMICVIVVVFLTLLCIGKYIHFFRHPLVNTLGHILYVDFSLQTNNCQYSPSQIYRFIKTMTIAFSLPLICCLYYIFCWQLFSMLHRSIIFTFILNACCNLCIKRSISISWKSNKSVCHIKRVALKKYESVSGLNLRRYYICHSCDKERVA